MSRMVHMNWGGVFPCEPDWTWDTADTPLPDHDLWVVFGGRGVMDTPAGTLPLARGDCLVLRPHQRYVCRTEASDPLLVHVVHYDYLDDTDPPAVHRPLLEVERFGCLTQRAIDAHLDGQADLADDWLRVVLHELDHQDRELAQRDAEAEPRLRRMAEIRREIGAHPGRRWRVAEIASACHTSPDHFTRLFSAAYGVTPREFILRRRIDAARRLLLSSSHSVARVAELTGFSDIYHFSRTFKARVGRPPSRFRRAVEG